MNIFAYAPHLYPSFSFLHIVFSLSLSLFLSSSLSLSQIHTHTHTHTHAQYPNEELSNSFHFATLLHSPGPQDNWTNLRSHPLPVIVMFVCYMSHARTHARTHTLSDVYLPTLTRSFTFAIQRFAIAAAERRCCQMCHGNERKGDARISLALSLSLFLMHAKYSKSFSLCWSVRRTHRGR